MRQISSFQPSQSTKLYMTLNGNSTDFSNSNNSGTDTAITYVQGKFGQGARFNGSTSNITKATPNGQPTTVFTMQGWFKTDNLTANPAVIFSLGKDGAGTGLGLELYNTGILNSEFQIGSNTGKTTSTTVIKPNVWYHVAVTADGTNTKLYVNGNLESSVSQGGGQTGGGSMVLGSWVNSSGVAQAPFFTGILDEMTVESRAWTPQEISLYYKKSMLNYKQRSLFNLLKDFVLTGDTAVFTITGYDATMTLIQRLVAETANFIITGYDAILKAVGAWRNPDNKSSSTYSNPDSKSSSTWTNRNKNI